MRQAERFADAGLPYPGNLVNRRELLGNVQQSEAPAVVLSGNIHARATQTAGNVLQLGCGALIEPPHDAAVVAVTEGLREVTRTVRRLAPAGDQDPVFAPERERWSWSGTDSALSAETARAIPLASPWEGTSLVTSVAVLNDVHGNLPALEAVLAEVDRESVDAIVCGGDVLSGAYQGECLGLLRERNARFLTGNSEREVLEATEGHEWAAAQLSEEERAFVSSWPATVSLDIAEIGRVLFCHGSPRSDEEMLTVLTPDDVLRDALQGVAAAMVVIGHTHHQFERAVDGIRLVNAGSVGLPYEGAAGAYWTLIGPDVVFRRTSYDIDVAAERLRASGMPGIDELLPESLLAPLPRDEVARYFEQQARPERG